MVEPGAYTIHYCDAERGEQTVVPQYANECSEGVTTGIMVNVQTRDPNGYRPNALITREEQEIDIFNHEHAITQQGGNQSHENQPQFTALAFLMRSRTP